MWIVKLAEEGLTRQQIAYVVGIGERTLYRWLSRGRELYIEWSVGSVIWAEMNFNDQLLFELYESVHEGTSEREGEFEVRLDAVRCEK